MRRLLGFVVADGTNSEISIREKDGDLCLEQDSDLIVVSIEGAGDLRDALNELIDRVAAGQ